MPFPINKFNFLIEQPAQTPAFYQIAKSLANFHPISNFLTDSTLTQRQKQQKKHSPAYAPHFRVLKVWLGHYLQNPARCSLDISKK